MQSPRSLSPSAWMKQAIMKDMMVPHIKKLCSLRMRRNFRDGEGGESARGRRRSSAVSAAASFLLFTSSLYVALPLIEPRLFQCSSYAQK